MASKDIALALREISALRVEATRGRLFYAGDQEDTYDQADWLDAFDGRPLPQPRDNMCNLTVDAIVARLRLRSLIAREDDEVNNAGAEQALAILRRNRGDQLLPKVHREAGKTRTAAVILGVNARGQAVFYSKPGDSVYVHDDPEFPGQRAWAAHAWTTDENRVRLNVYYPTYTERYVTNTDAWSATIPAAAVAFRPFDDDGRDAVRENPLGFVPVYKWSLERSDIHPLYRLQPLIDLSLCNLAILSHNRGFPQAYVTGVNLSPEQEEPTLGSDTTWDGQVDETHLVPDEDAGASGGGIVGGPRKLITMENPQAKAGVFAAADLEGTLKLLDNTRSAVLRNGSIPPHLALMVSGDYPTGKAMRTAEAQFGNNVEGRQVTFGNTWEDMLGDAVQAENSHNDRGEFVGLAPRPELEMQWESPYTPEELTDSERLTALIELGVPLEVILVDELGYSQERAEEIAQLKRDLDSARQAAALYGETSGNLLEDA